MVNIEFDKKLVCGPEYAAVRIIDNCEDLAIGNILIASNVDANGRLAHALVENVGSEVKEKFGIDVGDYVMIDRLSTFAHTAPVAALKYDGIICKTNATKTEFYPMRNMLFVEPIENEAATDVGGFLVPGLTDRLRTGKITAMNCDDSLKLPFKIGDTVMLSKGGDHVQFGTVDIMIYKHDMIVATIED